MDRTRRRLSQAAIATPVAYSLFSRPALGAGWECNTPSGFHSANVSTLERPYVCSGRTPGYWKTHPEEWVGYDPGEFMGSGNDEDQLSAQDIEDNPSAHEDEGTSNRRGLHGIQGAEGLRRKPDQGDGGGHMGSHATSEDLSLLGNEDDVASKWQGGTKFDQVFSTANLGAPYAGYTLMQVLWMGGNGDPYQIGAHTIAALLNAARGWTDPLTEDEVIHIWGQYDFHGGYMPTSGAEMWTGEEIVQYLQSTMTLA